MNPASAALLTTIIVVAGRWSKQQPMNMKVVVGGIVMLLFLAAMPEKLARQFGLLILLAALFTYGETLFKQLPLAEKAVKPGGGGRK